MIDEPARRDAPERDASPVGLAQQGDTMDQRQLLCGLRDCATRFGSGGGREQRLRDAFYRAERIEPGLLAGVAELLREKAGTRAKRAYLQASQSAALLALQERHPSLLDDLRGADMGRALEAAGRVVEAWWRPPRDPGITDRLSMDDLCFGCTVMLRCIAPARFPIVAQPADLLRDPGRPWQNMAMFMNHYREQVQTVQRVADTLGLQDSMRLHDGMQQMSRCLAAGTCKGSLASPRCRGMDLEQSFPPDGSRRDVLRQLARELKMVFAARVPTTLEACIDMMLPSEKALAEGLRLLQMKREEGKDLLPEQADLLHGLEMGLRMRLVDAGHMLVRDQAQQEASALGEGMHKREALDMSQRAGMQATGKRRRRRPQGASPSAREIADLTYTPRHTVSRHMGMSLDEVVQCARGNPLGKGQGGRAAHKAKAGRAKARKPRKG